MWLSLWLQLHSFSCKSVCPTREWFKVWFKVSHKLWNINGSIIKDDFSLGQNSNSSVLVFGGEPSKWFRHQVPSILCFHHLLQDLGALHLQQTDRARDMQSHVWCSATSGLRRHQSGPVKVFWKELIPMAPPSHRGVDKDSCLAAIMLH